MKEDTYSMVEEVVTLLRKRDFEALGQHKLATYKAVCKRIEERDELTHAFVGRQLADFVLDAIELMRPSPPEQISEPAWRYYILLRDYIARGQPWGVVSARLGLGRTAFYSARQDAIESLTMVIDALEAEARRELPRVSHNLPRPPYRHFIRRFVDGEDLVDKIIGEVGKRAWVIALYGAGGVGKTAVAYEVAKQCCQRRDFEVVAWTSMKEKDIIAGEVVRRRGPRRSKPADERAQGTTLTFGYETPLEVILEDIGRAFNVREILTLSTVHEKLIRVLELLATKSCLVVIDNLETLSGDAQKEIFNFLKELPVPSKAIVTSRERHYIGETIITVPTMEREEALRFLRSEAESRGLILEEEAMDTIYEKTDGVAKAMQYTLGLMSRRGYSVEQAVKPGIEQNILLDYLFERAYSELEEREKAILHVMPIFAEPPSTISIEIASTVSGVLLGASLGKLYQLFLLDKFSLEHDRYELPLLARSYLRSIRRRDGLEIMGKPIAEFLGEAYVRLIQHYIDRLSGIKSLDEKLKFLRWEKRNVIGLMDWCYWNERWDSLIALMHQMSHPLAILGYWDERVELAEKAIRAANKLNRLDESSWFKIYDIGWTYFLRRQFQEARELIESEYDLVQGREGFERVEALAIGDLGRLAQEAGDYKAALDRLEKSLVLWQKLEDQAWIGYAQARLGRLKREMGILHEAKVILGQALETRSRIGHVGEIAETLSELALVEYGLGNVQKALSLSDDSLTRARLEIEQPSPSYSFALYHRAELEEKEGNLLEAKRQARMALTLYRNLGNRYMEAKVRSFLERLESEEPPL